MPTSRLLQPLLITCLLTLGLGAASAQQKNALVQQYQPGKTYVLEVAINNETRSEPLESSQLTTTDITETFELKASKLGEQTLVKVRVSSIKAKVSLDGHLQQQYDSTNPALSPPLYQQTFGAIKDKAFTMVYDSQHRFVKFTDLTADEQTPIGKQLAFNTQQFAEAFRQQRDGILPTGALADSATWALDQRIVMPPLGELQLKGKATLDTQLNADKFQPAKFEGTLEIAPSVAPDKAPIIISEAKFNGSLLFDPARHQIATLESTTTFVINSPDRSPTHVKQTGLTTLLSVTDTAP